MKNLEIFCITNKIIEQPNLNYKMGWVGQKNPPEDYIKCDSLDNIFFKEKYYSELTFQYWFWKNLLKINDTHWIGFCQKRRYWIKKGSDNTEVDELNFKKYLLDEAPKEWLNYDSIICKPINVNKVNKMKLLKRGFRSLIKDPSIFFNKEKQSLLLHFDMHHGHGNMEKAISLLKENDREEFLNYLKKSTFYNPHIMFIARPLIIDRWFHDLFSWLSNCEKIFGFKKLQGYDTQRLYAYLAERYLSFWFRKYTKYKEWPWAFVNLRD